MFFFFKQKTAYEMRISDWSSDVCSSDLEVAVSTSEGDCLDDSLGDWPVGEDPELPSSPGDPSSSDEHAARTARDRTRAAATDLISPTLVLRVRPGSTKPRRARPGRGTRRGAHGNRSEEHTSELQSIMRI